MLDVGMLVYAGLLFLAVWRKTCSYWCCGLWLSILNYMSLLYVLLSSVLVYLLIRFYQAAQEPLHRSELLEARDLWSVEWLKPFVLISPIAVCVTLALNWLLTESHIFEIHKRLAMTKHDRAVQIIALPAVFALMALASMLPIFELMTGGITADMLASPWYDFKHPLNQHGDKFKHKAAGMLQVDPAGNFTDAVATGDHWKEAKSLALWRYETCFYVADLFEAWILYQFGRLVLEQVSESIALAGEESASLLLSPDSEEDPLKQARSKVELDLRDSHRAVAALTWVGTSIFVALCITQSACSFWPYLGGEKTEQDTIMFHLQVAGFVASCAAIYNLVVVERAFHRHLEHLWPVSKFLTVKLLVSLSFLQRGFLMLLQNGNQLLPSTMQQVVAVVPILGDILSFSDFQLHLFYPSLIIFECLLLAIIHLFVWRSNESWYTENGALPGEGDPLLPKLDRAA